jgi:hypothetical protein
MARLSADIDRRSLALSGRQVDLQKKQAQRQEDMWLANTVIAGTQAAAGLTSAAARLGQVFGELHDQKANLAIQTAATQYQAGVTEAITNGYDPYVVETLDDGQQIRRYIGYDNYKLADGTTLGQYKEQAVSAVGNMYWTKDGTQQGTQIAANAFENIELAAQRQTADAVIKNRDAVFNQELTNAITAYRNTGDPTQINQVISGATWMSEDEKRATALETERAAQYENIHDEALRIAGTKGIGEAQKYLDNLPPDREGTPLITADQKSKILSAAQHANNQSANTARAEALDAYDKTGGSIRQRYDAAAGGDTANPDVREARRNVASQRQTFDLEERFSREIKEAKTPAQLDALAKKLEEGGSYDADYYQNEQLQRQHHSYISRLIEEKKAEAARAAAQNERAGADAEKNDKNNTLDLMMDQWRSPDSGFDGRKVLEFMIANGEYISPAKKQGCEKELFGVPPASAEYARLESLLKSQKPPDKASAAEKMDYAQKEYEIKRAIINERMKGATVLQMREIINGFADTEATEVVTKAFEKGELNTATGLHALIGNRGETEAGLLYLMNQGKLDPYFGEITDASLGTMPFIAGDDRKVNAVMGELGARGRAFLNKELKAEGVTVGEYSMVMKAEGDKDGTMRFRGSDGNYYRVNAKGPKGPLFMEKWNAGNKSWEPYKAKKKAVSAPGYRPEDYPGYRPAAFPGDM